MIKMIKDKAFQDSECTCDCGNKHELYGGKGYTTIASEGTTSWNHSRYLHVMRCNVCNKQHTLQY